jgi:hypothetical protein
MKKLNSNLFVYDTKTFFFSLHVAPFKSPLSSCRVNIIFFCAVQQHVKLNFWEFKASKRKHIVRHCRVSNSFANFSFFILVFFLWRRSRILLRRCWVRWFFRFRIWILRCYAAWRRWTNLFEKQSNADFLLISNTNKHAEQVKFVVLACLICRNIILKSTYSLACFKLCIT